MSMSLREQLLAAGLGTKKQAKHAEHQERQQHHKARQAGGRKQEPGQTEQQQRAAQAQAEKAERDRELNRVRQEQAEHRARWAQVKQIVEQQRLPKLESDDYFNFIDRRKVRRMAVDPDRRARLIAGELFIVRCEGRYEAVNAETAARLRAIEARAVVSLDGAEASAPADQADDPYKDYVVPDDLMW